MFNRSICSFVNFRLLKSKQAKCVLVALCSFVFVATNLRLLAAEEISGTSVTFEQNDWPWWRGQNRDGISGEKQSPPEAWSESQNIIWKVDVPGRGHGSMTLVGKHVFLATADHENETQLVICYDRDSGDQVWERVVHEGGFAKKMNQKATLASSTVACDGQRLFINFLNDNAVYTSALSMDGEILWQKKITKYKIHQGYGSSPAIWKDLVIISADNKLGGAVAGLDRASGEIKWRVDRPKKPNYSSPAILKVSGKDQVIMTGCDLVTSLNPLNGEKNWEIKGATTECVTTPVASGDLIFTSGGYPDNHVSAVKTDGSGEVVWRNKTRMYVPSMLAKDGYLFAILDAGVAVCWNAQTGDEVWKERLHGEFTASPTFIGDKIYATSEKGKTFVLKASAEGCSIASQNQLGDEAMSTPVFADSRIYMRVAHYKGKVRREVLYCIGK